MKIYQYSNEEHWEELKTLFIQDFRRKTLVPFFGSGFTRDCCAIRGRVPSSDEFKTRLIDLITEIRHYNAKDKEQLKNKSLPEVGERFWSAVKEAEEQRRQFEVYMEDCFSGVHDLTESRQELIACGWPYLYTLNYDDAIESVDPELYCVKPYYPQNKRFLAEKRCLYKLHGDVREYLATGDPRFCIISSRQYLQAITDPDNEKMRERLDIDLNSNCPIFFGCGLIGEIDLLFQSDPQLIQQRTEGQPNRRYYVQRMSETSEPLTAGMQDDYEAYGITDFIEVQAQQMDDFYSFIHDVSEEADAVQAEDPLEPFMGFLFSQLDAHALQENQKYLFCSRAIQPRSQEKKIILPSFFIRRQVGIEMVKDIEAETGNLHILRGSHLSGKTYILIDILCQLQAKSPFYFQSGTTIAQGLLEKIVSMENGIFLFDEGVLTREQMDFLAGEALETMKAHYVHVIMAIDRSLGVFTRHYHAIFPEKAKDVQIYQVSSKLENTAEQKEFDLFKEKMGALGLIPPQPENSFLDYLIRLDEATPGNLQNILPDVHIFNGANCTKRLKAMLLFSNQDGISMEQAQQMGLESALFELCAAEHLRVAVQTDYLKEAEREPGSHQRIRFMNNSKYWVYRCLSEFSASTGNYQKIANAYYDIVRSIQHRYGVDTGRVMSKNYFTKVKPYYFLETLQFSLSRTGAARGSIELPQTIYAKLLPLLNNDYQFLHQKAKCLFWSSKRGKNVRSKDELLREAYQQVSRAYQLAEDHPNENTCYTLYHMQVTKVLVLVNFWRQCQQSIPAQEKGREMGKLLHEMCTLEQNLTDMNDDDEEGQLEDTDKQDIQWFFGALAAGKLRQFLLAEDAALAGQVITLARQVFHFQSGSPAPA